MRSTAQAYLSVALIVLLATISGHAQNGNVAGFGLTPCREIDSFVSLAPGRTAILGWAFGFMSGVNAMKTARDRNFRDLAGLNADLMLGSIRAYCNQHPDASVIAAVEAIQISRPLRLAD
ncbi:hypothetical protein HCU64_23810 [Methylobacterium sp. C25]|uniref:hypothetical protein n=1 Tax=Methylobacterium sp. C25 TaxID=2721622 RepID=UPI001F16CCD8|nr:hypothetical protein [Methylobacterium sp. C25]MCE4226772.1 hypothetical protein [Methylobacterium sp. C25]